MNAANDLLCPLDFSPLSERALKLAVEMCRRTGAKLVLEHNLECAPPPFLAVGWMWSGEHEARATERSQEAVARLEQVFAQIPAGVEYEAKITRGPLDAGILHLAETLPAGMIVMGTHGPTSGDHKSLTERIILRAPCPVLTIGESYDPESVFGVEDGSAPGQLSILIPFDFRSRSRAALAAGFALAERMPHRLHILHVVEPVAQLGEGGRPREDVTAIEKELRAQVPIHLAPRVEIHVRFGDPVHHILLESAQGKALFILLAAHGKSVVKRLLFGTRTLELLHGSSCPIWFVPPALQTAA